jgi:hypothetical protein
VKPRQCGGKAEGSNDHRFQEQSIITQNHLLCQQESQAHDQSLVHNCCSSGYNTRLSLTTGNAMSSSNSIVGSLERYTNRNMERDEIENCPHLKKLVQDEVEKKITAAIGETG